MFKPVPNAKGCIMVNIGALSNVIPIDAESYAVLAAVLGESGSDHTYVRIGEAPLCEYWQVQQLNAGAILVSRGQDNTIPTSFPTLTEFEYVLSASAIYDIVALSMSPSNISITGINGIEVEQTSTNVFEISMQQPVFQSSDNTIDITGAFPNYDLNVVRGTNGCCD